MEIPVYEAEESPCRAYVIQRRTKETRISVDLCLEGGEIRISTGIGFFDHMLTAFAFYGGLGLKIEAEGDLEVDGHHTVEDTGIVLGQALNRALGDRKGLRRFASACIPMDEALCLSLIHISRRSMTSVPYSTRRTTPIPISSPPTSNITPWSPTC